MSVACEKRPATAAPAAAQPPAAAQTAAAAPVTQVPVAASPALLPALPPAVRVPGGQTTRRRRSSGGRTAPLPRGPRIGSVLHEPDAARDRGRSRRRRAVLRLTPHHSATDCRADLDVLTGAEQGDRLAGSAARVRLTLRGRRLLAAAAAAGTVVATVLIVWAISVVGNGPLGQSGPAIPDTAPASVVVAPGDSLWTIARQVAPAADPRQVVTELTSRNRLDSITVRVGQRLLVRP